MEPALKCKLRKATEIPIYEEENSSSLLAAILGYFFRSKYFLLLSFLGILGFFLYFNQSNQLEEEREGETIKTETESNSQDAAAAVNDNTEKKVKKRKKKKTNEETTENDDDDDAINKNEQESSPQQIEEVRRSVTYENSLNPIIELNENQADDEILSRPAINEYVTQIIKAATEEVNAHTVEEPVLPDLNDLLSTILNVQSVEESERSNLSQRSSSSSTSAVTQILNKVHDVQLVESSSTSNEAINEELNQSSVLIDESDVQPDSQNNINNEISNLIDSITVSTQVKRNHSATSLNISVPPPEEEQQLADLDEQLKKLEKIIFDVSLSSLEESKQDEVESEDTEKISSDEKTVLSDNDDNEEEEDMDEILRTSEVNIQYTQPNVLQQININDYFKFAEADDAFKESLDDLSYDQEEMGSKFSLQTDKTIDSSMDDLSNLDKLNKPFEDMEKNNSEGSSSEKLNSQYEILELKKESSNENGFEFVDSQQAVEETESKPTIKSEINNQVDDLTTENKIDDISNRLQEQLSMNSLLSLYQVKHLNAIADNFHNLNEIAQAIRDAGLERSQLIFGIDFTISNLENGQKTFHGRSLHYHDSDIRNPYQKVIEILGKTLECFDVDGKIPAYGFGDSKTKDRKVFPFVEGGYCEGFPHVLESYNRIVEDVQLSGPTNFAPLIKEAIKIVERTKEYHILVIVADGQVTNERQTREAIVEASKHALSIVMVGVGDGPWDTMEEFDDSLPKRQFDNFQFVNYHEVTQNVSNPDEVFALNALMEIPDQYKSIKDLGLLKFGKK